MHAVLSSADFFTINFFSKFCQKYFQSVKQFVSRSSRRLVGPALGSNCLQQTPLADRVNAFVTGPFTNRQNILSPSSPDEGYSSPTTESRRRIHTSAECIMDMPGLRDDFCEFVIICRLGILP